MPDVWLCHLTQFLLDSPTELTKRARKRTKSKRRMEITSFTTMALMTKRRMNLMIFRWLSKQKQDCPSSSVVTAKLVGDAALPNLKRLT